MASMYKFEVSCVSPWIRLDPDEIADEIQLHLSKYRDGASKLSLESIEVKVVEFR